MGRLEIFISGEYSFVVFIGADYKRCLWIYKITQFSYCFGKGWVVVVKVDVKYEQKEVREGVQILVILWGRNNCMSPF